MTDSIIECFLQNYGQGGGVVAKGCQGEDCA